VHTGEHSAVLKTLHELTATQLRRALGYPGWHDQGQRYSNDI